MDETQRLQCAIEALACAESGNGIDDWYAKWYPGRADTSTTEQSSLRRQVVEHALWLIAPEIPTWHSYMRKALESLSSP